MVVKEPKPYVETYKNTYEEKWGFIVEDNWDDMRVRQQVERDRLYKKHRFEKEKLGVGPKGKTLFKPLSDDVETSIRVYIKEHKRVPLNTLTKKFGATNKQITYALGKPKVYNENGFSRYGYIHNANSRIPEDKWKEIAEYLRTGTTDFKESVDKINKMFDFDDLMVYNTFGAKRTLTLTDVNAKRVLRYLRTNPDATDEQVERTLGVDMTKYNVLRGNWEWSNGELKRLFK